MVRSQDEFPRLTLNPSPTVVSKKINHGLSEPTRVQVLVLP